MKKNDLEMKEKTVPIWRSIILSCTLKVHM